MTVHTQTCSCKRRKKINGRKTTEATNCNSVRTNVSSTCTSTMRTSVWLFAYIFKLLVSLATIICSISGNAHGLFNGELWLYLPWLCNKWCSQQFSKNSFDWKTLQKTQKLVPPKYCVFLLQKNNIFTTFFLFNVSGMKTREKNIIKCHPPPIQWFYVNDTNLMPS